LSACTEEPFFKSNRIDIFSIDKPFKVSSEFFKSLKRWHTKSAPPFV
jgi:hypothetical protein